MSLTNSLNSRISPLKSPRIETNQIDTQFVLAWSGIASSNMGYNVNQWDEIRRSCIIVGPYQTRLSEYLKCRLEKYPRRF